MKAASPIAKTANPNTLAGRLRTAGAARLLPLLLLLTLPAVVQAQYDYITNNGTITITLYTGTNAVVTIPSTTNGLPVTTIGDAAFSYCTNLTSVTIPNSITNIGDYAFVGCTSLTNVTIGTSVISIGEGAFGECTSLRSVTIPDSVASIGALAFYSCTSLTNATIGNSVTNIGEKAFVYCTSLPAITVVTGNPAYSSVAGVLFDKNTNTLIAYPGGKGGSSYTISNTVTNIGTWAFYYCTSLASVTIPNSVTNIGSSAFQDCTNLASITIPNSVTTIGSSAFYECINLTGVTMGTNVITIGTGAFAGTSLTNVTIPNRVITIEAGAFYYCTSLTNVIIGTNVTSIGNFAFYYCTSLTSITIPNRVSTIGDNAFYQCTSLASATIGTNVTSIGGGAFASTSLTHVTIPNSVTSLGAGAFYYCTSLTNITIGTNVTSIGDQTFQNCTGLTSVTIPNRVTSIGGGAFQNCTELTSITIPNGVTNIGGWAFYSCTSLTNVTIGTNVTSIEEGAFVYCPSLPAITVATNNPAYSSVAGVLFNKSTNTLIEYPGGKGGSSYTIFNTVTNIGTWAFYYCTSLTSITIPNSVTNIGNNAFQDCTNLTGVYFQGNAPSLGGSSVFSGDTNAIVYYWPGTTGWGPTFGGLTAVELPGIPILAITAPTDGLRVSNANYTITGTAADAVAVTNVYYALNNSGWTPATTANHWAAWSAPVNLIPGTNTIAAYAVDTNGKFSLTNRVGLDCVLNTVLTVLTNGHGTISPNYNGAVLQIGQSYNMTATASTGYGFTGWTGSSTTNAATLIFVMASNLTFTANFIVVTNPVLTITAPTSRQRWSNAVFTVTGTARDNLQVSNVVCQVNGGAWSNAITGNVWTNWTAAVNLIPGTNTVAAYAVDTIGLVSTTNSVSFQYVATNQLQVQMSGRGTVSPNYSNAWLEIGRNYSITSTPASGFAFTNWVISTNWIGGTTTTKTNLQFMMASNLTLQANFLDTSKPTLAISAPAAGQHMTNALATVVGTASDNWKVSAVWYQLTNKIMTSGTWNLATTTNNYTNWTTTVTLAAGTNMVKAYAVDLGGNYSTTSSVSVLSSNTFKLQLNFAMNQPLTSTGLNFTLQISSNLNGHIQISTNLLDWATLTNFVGTNTTLNFRDPAATNSNHRFYRAIIP